MDAGQDGEEAVEAGDFVKEEREGGEFGAGAEGHEVEERLESHTVSRGVAEH